MTVEVRDLIAGLALVVALYGAILSTYNYRLAVRKDRRTVDVRLTTTMMAYLNTLGPRLLTIQVVNVGQRAVTVSPPVIVLPDKKHMTLLYADGFANFPKSLSDGESASLTISYRDLARAMLHHGYTGTVKFRAICKDTAGGVHRSRHWTFDPKEEAAAPE